MFIWYVFIAQGFIQDFSLEKGGGVGGLDVCKGRNVCVSTSARVLLDKNC